MSGGEFNKLYRELCNDKVSGKRWYADITFEKQRNDVMRMIGLQKSKKVTGVDPDVRSKVNIDDYAHSRVSALKYHGTKARYKAHEARQLALKRDSGADAKKRLSVRKVVNEAQHTVDVSKNLAHYIKNGLEIPPRLMRELLGADAMRGNANEGGKDDISLPSIIKRNQKPGKYMQKYKSTARVPSNIKEVVPNLWTRDERLYLNNLYKEIPRPDKSSNELWDIYYKKMYDRFRPFFRHRSKQEVIEKVEQMVTQRLFKTVEEDEYWEAMKGCKVVVKEEPSPVRVSPSKLSTVGSMRASQALEAANSILEGESLGGSADKTLSQPSRGTSTLNTEKQSCSKASKRLNGSAKGGSGINDRDVHSGKYNTSLEESASGGDLKKTTRRSRPGLGVVKSKGGIRNNKTIGVDGDVQFDPPMAVGDAAFEENLGGSVASGGDGMHALDGSMSQLTMN